MLAAVFGLPEETVGKWLDLYYQVRRAYEVERGAAEDPRLIRREDLAPVLREIWQEALDDPKVIRREDLAPAMQEALQAAMKKTAADEARKLQEKKAALLGETVQDGTKKAGPWTMFKRKVVDKLADARAAGVSIASIAAASAGVLSEARVMDAINAGQLSREEWYALDRAIGAAAAAAE